MPASPAPDEPTPEPPALLPSWRSGTTRDALVEFLDRAEELPVEARVACFDNDGTLWCERPQYVQYDFFLDALAHRAAADAAVAEVPAFAALLDHDAEALEAIGLTGLALALAGLFEGRTAAEFTDAVRAYAARAVHADTGRPLADMRYQPMLELVEELRRRRFTVAIVTGGGTEFVRALSGALYGVTPERVVGTLVDYRYETDGRDAPVLRRTATISGAVNEGPAKVGHIQAQLGRRPVLAAGNSAGDAEMLDWAHSAPIGLGLLIDHDDAAREYAYASVSGTLAEVEPVTARGRRSGWTVVSMARDWECVFPSS